MRSMYLFMMILFIPLTGVNAQELHIANETSSVTFVFEDGEVEGSLDDFEFTGRLTGADRSQWLFSGSVATKTLDTGNWLRNKILRGRKYFNADEFPRITFSSTSVSDLGDRLLVTGDLSMNGISLPISITFSQHLKKLQGSALINAADWGINVYDKKSRNTVRLSITLPLTGR